MGIGQLGTRDNSKILSKYDMVILIRDNYHSYEVNK